MKIKKSELKKMICGLVISELGRMSILNEGLESKNLSKARKVVRKYCNIKDENSAWEVLNGIRREIPNSRIYSSKYLRGVIRLVFKEELENTQCEDINTILEVLCNNSELAEKYDGDFNGLYYEELFLEFYDKINELTNNEREAIRKLKLTPSNRYRIIPIMSFQDAYKFGKFTEWCINKSEGYFEQYTSNGQSFYFIIRNGFEDIAKSEPFSTYKDDYGLSMIAISVNKSGRLLSSTSRYNESITGNKILNTIEISQLIGRNFYEVFKSFQK